MLALHKQHVLMSYGHFIHPVDPDILCLCLCFKALSKSSLQSCDLRHKPFEVSLLYQIMKCAVKCETEMCSKF